jgi:hypothetical protein
MRRLRGIKTIGYIEAAVMREVRERPDAKLPQKHVNLHP